MLSGGREDLQELVAHQVGRPAREPDQQVLGYIEGVALGAPDRDQPVPVRVVPDAYVVGVELRLPLPVVQHEGPFLQLFVGRPHQARVLLVHLVQAVPLHRVNFSLGCVYGPDPVAPGHLVEHPVYAVEEKSGAHVVLLRGLDLLDHAEPVDVHEPLERLAVDVGR